MIRKHWLDILLALALVAGGLASIGMVEEANERIQAGCQYVASSDDCR